MTKEQIEEFSDKLIADGHEFILIASCDNNVCIAFKGKYLILSLYLAGQAATDDEFRRVFEDAVKMYKIAKENGYENGKEKQPNV